jgi:uncharacterized protein YdiU (UPF0061 family)
MEFAKKFVQDFAQLFNAALGIDADKDKKITFVEVGSLLMVLVAKTMANYPTAIQALEEIRDAFAGPEKQAERQELVAVFGDNFDLENDEIENLVEEWLFQLVEVYGLIIRTADAFKK